MEPDDDPDKVVAMLGSRNYPNPEHVTSLLHDLAGTLAVSGGSVLILTGDEMGIHEDIASKAHRLGQNSDLKLTVERVSPDPKHGGNAERMRDAALAHRADEVFLFPLPADPNPRIIQSMCEEWEKPVHVLSGRLNHYPEGSPSP